MGLGIKFGELMHWGKNMREREREKSLERERFVCVGDGGFDSEREWGK